MSNQESVSNDHNKEKSEKGGLETPKPDETDIETLRQKVDKFYGAEESDTGLAPSAYWNLELDRRKLMFESSYKVGTVERVYKPEKQPPRYMIKCGGRHIVELEEPVKPEDIETGMRVGVNSGGRSKIAFSLPGAINPTIALMEVEEKPDITYADIGGCKVEIEKLREVVEFPLLYPDRYTILGIDPPKGVLLYGPPGTGKTLCARAVANRTDACFIRILGSELVRKYTGEGPKMVRDLFQLAKSKKACIMFFDEVDSFGGARVDDGAGGNNEVQRTMLELINQLDGFDPRGNIKVIMATNRPDTLDPALMRPGRLDRKIEFGPPDIAARANIFRIYTNPMSVERGIRHDLLARLCPNCTGADIRCICTEAGLFAIRNRRKMATEKDFLDAVTKVVKRGAKFSATPSYMTHN
ncbi:ATPase family associated with various cellular activities (AAA) domain-containing protein [Ditylenchus destructor]|nr:ATPase family associated with various cellular activities (AAA) domain-containing protein [Ditylenchus destructor]